ncbi:MAG: carbohydrate kinase family protein [Chloroflexi bacterium]|nr:carbohydrate kinase family protein [Chloroflexota bacterium]MBP8057190.1 carbohydrate kinase family protein [Chloroflexota bacterium]
MSEHILVIGASLMDTKGKPLAGLQPHTSNPGIIRQSRGGTARNVAENLGRLGADVVLISAIGPDRTGQMLQEATEAAGVNVAHLIVAEGYRTGSYIALLNPDGSLSVAIDDTSVAEQITPHYLYQYRHLFRDAQMLMVDGSLTEEALAMVMRLAQQYSVPVCADPSSARLAYKLCPYLAQLHLVVPNEVEATALCGVEFPGFDPESSIQVARQLVTAGVQNAVVTLSDFGLAYATPVENGYIPPRYNQMVDSTGTGDAITAAILFALLNGMETIEAMRLAAAAAGLTLQTEETVVPDLSLDMLYNHLTV